MRTQARTKDAAGMPANNRLNGATRSAATGEKILVVDDDQAFLRLLAIHLKSLGYDIVTATGGGEALATLKADLPRVVITDLKMQGIDGLGVLDAVVRQHPGLPVIILTAHGSIPDAVAATRNGAFGFLTKPIDKTELRTQIARAMAFSSASINDDDWVPEIVTRSPAMVRLIKRARAVASSDGAVLIEGDSGTGKELIARAIHRGSTRSGDFVAVNCATSAADLDSELFGNTLESNFAGASIHHSGLLMTAHEGTLFLDEVAEMPMSVQAKLLRMLQDEHVAATDGTTGGKVDVRIISATQHDLQANIAAGTFREDLFYRLNVLNLEVPSLEQRREDIPLLVNHFLQKQTGSDAVTGRSMSPDAMERLVAAKWPGNVRQLENLVIRCAIVSDTPVISAKAVDEAIGESTNGLPSLAEAREAFTRDYLTRLLTLTDGNVTRAARLAHRNRTEFYKLLSRHSVIPSRFKHRRNRVNNKAAPRV